jgi:hypothetical protein
MQHFLQICGGIFIQNYTEAKNISFFVYWSFWQIFVLVLGLPLTSFPDI